MNIPRANTTSLDLPPSLQRLLNMPSGPSMQAGQSMQGASAPNMPNGMAPNTSALGNAAAMPVGQRADSMPSYAEGGMVGPSGQPIAAGLAPTSAQGMPVDQQGPIPMGSSMAPSSGAMSGQGQNQITEADVQQFMQQNPQAVQQLSQQLQMLIQSGEVNIQQMQMAEQLATVALNNPELFPQMRQFALRQGLATEADLPAQYDEGFLFTVILAARAATGGAEGGQGMGASTPAQGQSEMANMADGGIVTAGEHAAEGGAVKGAGTTTSDSIPIKVSKGEYVIPAHIVQMKGKEFFDSMLEKYKDSE